MQNINHPYDKTSTCSVRMWAENGWYISAAEATVAEGKLVVYTKVGLFQLFHVFHPSIHPYTFPWGNDECQKQAPGRQHNSPMEDMCWSCWIRQRWVDTPSEAESASLSIRAWMWPECRADLRTGSRSPEQSSISGVERIPNRRREARRTETVSQSLRVQL